MSAVITTSRGSHSVVESESAGNLLNMVLDFPVDSMLSLIDSMAVGNTAAVICNTVDNARNVYQALKARMKDGDDVVLLHSRFIGSDRLHWDQVVEELFGLDAVRSVSGRRIVVGTQVIEQSLDIDFDVMFTEPAPMENILQRAGRLHRHRVRDSSRGKFGERVLYVLAHDETLLKSGGLGHVYSLFHVRNTLAVLSRITGGVRIPEQVKELVKESHDFDDALMREWTAAKDAETTKKKRAGLFLVGLPIDRNSDFYGWNAGSNKGGEEVGDFDGSFVQDESSGDDVADDDEWKYRNVRGGFSGITVATLFLKDGKLCVPMWVDGRRVFIPLDPDGESWRNRELILSSMVTLPQGSVKYSAVLENASRIPQEVRGMFSKRHNPLVFDLTSKGAEAILTAKSEISHVRYDERTGLVAWKE